MTEDDTFEALRRCHFEEVNRAYFISGEQIFPYIGWAFTAYADEFKTRRRSSIRANIRSRMFQHDE